MKAEHSGTFILRLSVALFVMLACAAGGGATQAASSDGATNSAMLLQRTMSHQDVLVGESFAVQFAVHNTSQATLSYTLTEEVPPGVAVKDVEGGNMNANAGIVVWSGSLPPGGEARHAYVAAMMSGETDFIEFHSFLNPSEGKSVVSSGSIARFSVVITASVDGSGARVGEQRTVVFVVSTPVGRTGMFELDWEHSDVLVVDAPEQLNVDTSGLTYVYAEVMANAKGSYEVAVTPRLNGTRVGKTAYAMLHADVSEVTTGVGIGSRISAPSEHELPRIVRETRFRHDINISSGVVSEDGRLLFIASLEPGVSLVADSLFVDGHMNVALLDQDYIAIELPSQPFIEVAYALQYEAFPADHSYAVIWMKSSPGEVPRVIWGRESLLSAMDLVDEARRSSAREYAHAQEGVKILDPLAGSAFVEHDQIKVIVDGPLHYPPQLFVNGVEVSDAQVGDIATDETHERLSRKFIAVKLDPGENILHAVSTEPSGAVWRDEITVYRAQAPSKLSIQPITPLETGRVQPLLFEIAAEDIQGFPAPDGTTVSIVVHGADVLSVDARPDQLGHQLVLYRGRGYIRLAPPQEATVLHMSLALGELTLTRQFRVTAQADGWIIVGHAHGAAHLVGSGVDRTEADLRLYARGTTASGRVLTIGVDTYRWLSQSSDDALWWAEGAGEGRLIHANSHVFLRSEDGLDFVEYATRPVRFSGELSTYTRSHTGGQLEVTDARGATLKAFIAKERSTAVEEELRGDGTGYYRVKQVPIDPGSEQLQVIYREAMFPYPTVKVEALRRDEYILNEQTGEIWLRQALPAFDLAGNMVLLRVRYMPISGGELRPVGGIQAQFPLKDWLTLQGTLLQGGGDGTPFLLGSRVEIGSVNGLKGEVEIARTSSAIKGIGQAHIMKVSTDQTHPWSLVATLRHVDTAFEHPSETLVPGNRASVALRRSIALGWVEGEVTRGWGNNPASEARELRLTVKLATLPHQPELRAKLGNGLNKEPVASVGGTMAFDALGGTLQLSHDQTVVGNEPDRTVIVARRSLTERIHVRSQLNWLTGTPESQAQFGTVVGVEYKAGPFAFTTGYHNGDDRGAELRYGLQSRWQAGERSSVVLGFQQTHPFGEGLDSVGGAIDWSYAWDDTQLSFRLDQAWRGDKPKRSLALTAVRPMNDRFAYYVEGAWRQDDQNVRQTYRLGFAYKDEDVRLAALRTDEAWQQKDDLNAQSVWLARAAVDINERLTLHIGFTDRRTSHPVRTFRVNLGGTWAVGERTRLEFDASTMGQPTSGTEQLGIKLAISQQLTPELRLSVGAFTDSYRGIGLEGDGFAHLSGNGLFIGFDFSFDETSFGGLFQSLLARSGP